MSNFKDDSGSFSSSKSNDGGYRQDRIEHGGRSTHEHTWSKTSSSGQHKEGWHGSGAKTSGNKPSSGGGGGCFIATVAYGSPLADEVSVLRKFRDERLIRSKAGRTIILIYNFFGPIGAVVVSRSLWLKKLTRILLKPVIQWLK
jgi:hypothetical protein